MLKSHAETAEYDIITAGKDWLIRIKGEFVMDDSRRLGRLDRSPMLRFTLPVMLENTLTIFIWPIP